MNDLVAACKSKEDVKSEDKRELGTVTSHDQGGSTAFKDGLRLAACVLSSCCNQGPWSVLT